MQHASFYAYCLNASGFRVKPGMTANRIFLNGYNGVDLHSVMIKRSQMQGIGSLPKKGKQVGGVDGKADSLLISGGGST